MTVAARVAAGARTNQAKLGLLSRHQLFPQVLRLVIEYVERKVDFRGCDPRELGHQKYVMRMVERLLTAIEPDESEGEPPLLPILNRYKPIGTTAEVDFKTTQACQGTRASHVNQVVADTRTWEQSAAFRLEELATQGVVDSYVRNDRLGLNIPYEYGGLQHNYEPDFIVRLRDKTTVVLEIKGYEHDETKAKHAGAQRWISAVNNWGQLGVWSFHVCRDPQLLSAELSRMLATA